MKNGKNPLSNADDIKITGSIPGYEIAGKGSLPLRWISSIDEEELKMKEMRGNDRIQNIGKTAVFDLTDRVSVTRA